MCNKENPDFYVPNVFYILVYNDPTILMDGIPLAATHE